MENLNTSKNSIAKAQDTFIKTIIDKARFSQHQISIEELEIVEQFYQDKTNAYFKQANLFKKIYLRYLIAVL